MRRTAALAVGLAGAAAILAHAQQPPPFRAGVQTVAVYASAVDRYGEMVLGLTRDDFEILDDGKPQAITQFVAGLEPITAMLLVDTSASMTLNLELARSAAEQFVIRMLPGDRVRVGSFSSRIDLGTTFTDDRDALLKSLRDGLDFGKPTRLWDAVTEAITTLVPLGGRQVILLLTDGMDTMSTTREMDVLARSRAEELMIYVVQFRSNFRANLAEEPSSPTPGQLFSDPRYRNPAPTEALRQIARQTGGGHFLLTQTDDLNATFTHVMQELHYQYVLGFTPQNLDGKLHEIRVRATTRPGVTIRARQSYLARAARPLP